MSNITSPNKSPINLNSTTKKIGLILESMVSFADSFGLKPFEIITADTNVVKSNIRLSEKYVSLIPDNHALLIFAVYNTISSADVNAYIDSIAKQKHASLTSLNTYRKYLAEHINKFDKTGKNWSSRQADIAIDRLVTAATIAQLESLVIRDFNMKKLNTALGLTVRGLDSFAIVALFNEQNNSFPFNHASKESFHNYYRHVLKT